MTKEEFYEKVNYSRYPKYLFSQIKEGSPSMVCSSIICTASDLVLLAKYENGRWRQTHFTSPRYGVKQEIYYTDLDEEVLYWTDGPAEDCSRNKNE